MSLSFQLGLQHLHLPFGFVKVLGQAFDLLLLRIKLNPGPGLHVLLNFHPQNISVDGQRHPVGNRLDFPLFLFNRPAHIADPLLHSGLHVFARLHLFTQLRLVLGNLAPHLFVVGLEL